MARCRVLAAVLAVGLLAASCADDRARATDREQQTESASESESESESSGDTSGDRVAHYERVVDELPDPESVTVLVVAGATREEVARELDVDLTEPVDEDDIWSSDGTGWAMLDISGGVLAMEPTGYGDPALAALGSLSAMGGAVAVARSNIDGSYRFGVARDGELIFDDDEYEYVDPSTVPAALRTLFDLVWVDLDAELDPGDSPGPLAVALAMGEVVTGVEVSADQIAALLQTPFFRGPGLVYP